jgi:hypothetical protein
MTEAVAAAVAPVAGADGTPAVVAPVVADLSLDAAPVAKVEPAAEAVTYEPTGDAGLDVALDFVAGKGFAADHPAMQAASEGDFGPIREALKALGDKAKGYEKYVALAEKSFNDTKAGHDTRRAKDIASIEGAVGGKEAWQEVKTWAAAATEDSPAQRAEVNAALRQGGMIAVAMAKHLTHLYNKSGAQTKEPAAVVQPGATGRPEASGPLTAKAYAQESQALRAKLGYRFDGSQEQIALDARRLAARAAGH